MIQILATWQAMTLHRSVRHETCITAILSDKLNAAFEADGREWFAVPEVQETDPTFGTQLGRNDIRFFPAPHRLRAIFFTAECKRLHVRTSSGFKHLADKYVTQGMKRFVNSEYSKGLPCGGMVGYVMDHDLDAAFGRVRSEIAKRQRMLRISTPHPDSVPSVALPAWSHSADTAHRRSDGEFLLHHLLVGVE
ncbi:MAG: hypothetical protein ABI614_24950 [Planctomycetota bacterium]